MRILWMGDNDASPLSVCDREDKLFCVNGYAAFRAALAGAQVAGEDWVCLIDFDSSGGHAQALALLKHAYPLVPVGLVTRNEDREAAFALLRSRAVDRVVPASDLHENADFHVESLAEHGRRLRELQSCLAPLRGLTLLVTGATGFLGGHFLRYLLRCGEAQVVALVRGTSRAPFDQRLTHLQDLYPARIRCIQGDVRLPGLGVAPEERDRLSASVDALWHLAADTRFEDVLREELFRTNLEGTRNVVEFARALSGLRRFYHVSTAYVAGDQRPGSTMPEARLARPASFKNPYEESKFAAECAVAESGLPATIFRPSIILGERVSGLCDGQTVYKVAQLLRLARLSGQRSHAPGEQSFRVVVDPETTKNLVSADDVVYHMLRLAAEGAAPGGFHHLTHPNPTPMADLISVIAGVLNIPEYEAVSTLDGATLSVSEAVLQRISGVFKPYMLNSDPEFHRGCPAAWARPLDHEGLRFLLQSFFEQHYGWEFQPGAATA